MHRYRLPAIPLTEGGGGGAAGTSASSSFTSTPGRGGGAQQQAYPPKPKLSIDDTFHDDTDADGLGRATSASTTTLESAVPLMRTQMDGEESLADNEVVFDGDEEIADGGRSIESRERGEIVPYAHRDIKPG